jgi:hypothetical protein
MRAFAFIGALSLLALAGCSSDDDASSGPAVLLAPPPPGQGIQYMMKTRIEPGQEIERCMFVKAPAEGMWVHRQELKYKAGSHHFLVYDTTYEEIPTVTLDGVTVDTSGVFDCDNGATADWDARRFVGGAQSADAPNQIDGLPEGAAVQIRPGAVLLLDGHYLNTATTAQDTEVRVNFWTMPEEKVTVRAGIYFTYNPFIRVPAHGKASARMRCPVPNEVTIVNGQSHMHRRGVKNITNLVDASKNPMEQLYTTEKWEEVPVKSFAGKKLPAGSFLDVQCDYDNQEDRVVLQGGKTTDEMCVFAGVYYPYDENFEACSNSGWADRFSAATWVGTGEASGLTTLLCLSKANSAETFFGCMVDACPAVADEVTAFLHCNGKNGDACDTQCKDGPDGCAVDCVKAACSGEIDAVVAKTCD